MSKDNTCSGFSPEVIDEEMAEEADRQLLMGNYRVTPRPIVSPEAAVEFIAEIDDLTRWCAELAAPTWVGCSVSEAARLRLMEAAQALGSARALVIMGNI